MKNNKLKVLQWSALLPLGLGLLIMLLAFRSAPTAPARYGVGRTFTSPSGAVSVLRGKQTGEWEQWRLRMGGAVFLGGGLIFSSALLGLYCQHRRTTHRLSRRERLAAHQRAR